MRSGTQVGTQAIDTGGQTLERSLNASTGRSPSVARKPGTAVRPEKFRRNLKELIKLFRDNGYDETGKPGSKPVRGSPQRS